MFLFAFNFNMKTHSNLINKIQCEFNSIQVYTSRTPAVGIDKSRTWNLIEWENNRHTSELFCGLQYISNGLIWMWSLFPPCSDGSGSIELCVVVKNTLKADLIYCRLSFMGEMRWIYHWFYWTVAQKTAMKIIQTFQKRFMPFQCWCIANEKSKHKKSSQYFQNSVFSILLLVITILRVECIKSHIWLHL